MLDGMKATKTGRQASVTWEALAGRSNARDDDFTNLWQFDDKLPEDIKCKTKRLDKFSIESASERWPNSDTIIAYLFDKALEAKEFSQMDRLIINYMQNTSDYTRLMEAIIETLVEENLITEVKDLCNKVEAQMPHEKVKIEAILT